MSLIAPPTDPDPDSARTAVVGLGERIEASSVEPHTHRRGQLLYAERGALTASTDAGSWVLPPHRALWIPGGHRHAFAVRRTADVRMLYVAPGVDGDLPWPGCVVVAVPPLLRELILATAEAPWIQAPDGPEARLARVLLDRLATIPQDLVHLPEPNAARARRLAALLHADPADQRSIQELAREAGASVRALERAFVRDTRLSVGAWRRQLRLVHAIEQLADGASVGDAAFSAGYLNPSSFIAAFRKALGGCGSCFCRSTYRPVARASKARIERSSNLLSLTSLDRHTSDRPFPTAVGKG